MAASSRAAISSATMSIGRFPIAAAPANRDLRARP
jgi:hypothetical protein